MRRKYRYSSRQEAEAAVRKFDCENNHLLRLLSFVINGREPDVDFWVSTADHIRGWDVDGYVDGFWIISVEQSDGHEIIVRMLSGLDLRDEMRDSPGALLEIGAAIEQHVFAWRHESKSLVDSPNP